MTRIETLIGDKDILQVLLEGFLAQWDGCFDVLSADHPPTYLFEPRTKYAALCQKVRSVPEGEVLCAACDWEHAELAKEKGEPIHYLCHAGMLDIAVPILLEDGELVATVLCGQCRSWDEQLEQQARARARHTASDLGLDPLELIQLRDLAPLHTKAEVEAVKERLWRVATYMARAGQEKRELERIRVETTRESQHIQSLMTELTGIVTTDEFWDKLGRALESMCEVTGASYAAFFVCDEGPNCEEVVRTTYRLRAVGNLPPELFQETYPANEKLFRDATRDRKPKVIRFDPQLKKTFCWDLAEIAETRPDKVGVIPFELTGEHRAVMVFFLDEERDLESGLPIEQEVNILAQVSPQIATAYENCLLYTQQKDLAREKDLFLEDVGHQLLSPLTGIQADSDRLHRYLGRWESERVNNQVLAIRGMSRWAARLTRNLVWMARTGGRSLRRTKWTEMTGFLIGCAIDVQGMAAYKGLRVHVDKSSTDALPELLIDRERFTQAVVNLLDNAVKYSKRNTEVYIRTQSTSTEASISVTNYGIPLRAEDRERIFKRGERTEEAEQAVPGGTGIGLPVALEIVHLHGGTISVEPSDYDASQRAHRVVFTIRIPIRSGEV